MLIKFITRSVRSLGMFLIFIFAAACIFGSMFVRDIENDFIRNSVHYTVSFENRFYDSRMRSLLSSKHKSKDIVLVKIDDYSLEKLGMWPIPRTYHAKMIDKLGTFGAKVIALDVLFPEKSPSYGKVNPDTVLVDSIKKFTSAGGSVYISYNLTDSYNNLTDKAKELPVEMYYDTINSRTKEAHFIPEKINQFTLPIPELMSSGAGVAFIAANEDLDGIFRQYKLVANVGGDYFGSLALNSYQAFVANKPMLMVYEDASGDMKFDSTKIEIDRRGMTKIRYIGDEEQFDSISLYNLLEASKSDKKMHELLNGKLVFVGSTALGAHDLRPSPINSKMPGVYSHMNMANMLLTGYFYKGLDESIKYSLLFLLGGMLIFLIVQRMGNAFLDAAVIGAIISGSFLADKYYFLPNGYELKLFYCYFCFITCYSWNTFLKFYEASKEKKQIRGTFARYVAPTIVDEMLKDPDKLHVGGTKMDITCLFSDVRDFTKISEGLTATELAHSLNIYMGAMTDIVFDTKGTLDKYIGDAIVALWGAPLEIGNHAQYAVEGAIKMMERLPAINDEFRKLGRPEFHIGIGLNSGECSVGNMGSERIFSYTALGDNMNLGARLESLCKHYGAQILISDMTLERLDLTHIKTRPIDKVVVKGKTTAVGVHEVLHSGHWMSKNPEYLNRYLLAHQLFQKKNFSEAVDVLNQLIAVNEEDKPCRRLREICKKFTENPALVTDDFEVTVMTEK